MKFREFEVLKHKENNSNFVVISQKKYNDNYVYKEYIVIEKHQLPSLIEALLAIL